ncbi:MAG: L-fuculose-phosphate aldolase [Firmicutes bacterium]|jgi:L-fuculose-phosphate aldolase|nr:L-fuculose-phosphate aldolase [Bacillota bacterium]
MKYLKERELLIEYGKNMLDKGLTKGSGGNLSIFIREEKLMLITPSGIDYYKTKPEDIVVMDLEGNVVDGERKPSSEHALHSIFYKKRDDIDAIVHFHSVYASTLASLRWDLPASYYLIAVSGGSSVRCAKYATFGTDELAENVFEAMEDRYVAFLANHGLIAGAKDLPNAFNKAEEIELCSEIYYRAKSIGEPVVLDKEETDNLKRLFSSYGQVKTD